MRDRGGEHPRPYRDHGRRGNFGEADDRDEEEAEDDLRVEEFRTDLVVCVKSRGSGHPPFLR